MSNALDAALVDLYAAINSLEIHRPTVKNVEEAKDKAKKAAIKAGEVVPDGLTLSKNVSFSLQVK